MENEFPTIESYIGRLEQALKAAAPRDTGALGNSIEATIDFENGGFTVNVSMLEYGVYQDQGVNGSVTKWGSPYSFKDKAPPANAFGAPTLSAGFAIARSIFKKGIKPTHFIDETIDQYLPGLQDVAGDGLLEYLEKQFSEE